MKTTKLFQWLGSAQHLARIRSFELGMLIILLLVTTGIWAFIELADEVLEGETRRIDEWIILAMRSSADLSDPLGPAWLEEVMRDVTALGGIAILTGLTLSVIGFLLLQQKKKMAYFMTVSIFGGLLLSLALKEGFDRPRPDLVSHESLILTASFPSGHSMLSAIVFLTLGGLLVRYIGQKKLKIYVLSLSILATLLVGCSRVYLGVHWPSDILAGWVAGSSWALICWFIALYLQRRGRIEETIES
jgi:undecaprenyl-diphosphatase